MKIVGLFIGAFLLYQGVDSLVRALLGTGDLDISGITGALAGLYLIHRALSSTMEPTKWVQKKSPLPNKSQISSTPPTLSTDESLDEVNRLIDEGQIMEAISQYRAQTGHNLKECKAYIDQYLKQKEGTPRS